MESWDISTLDVEPHKPTVLSTDDAARVVAISIPGGEALDDHQVHEHAYIVVVDGELEIGPAGDTTTARPGFVAHFTPNERHEVRAASDARVVLFLAPWPGEGHSRERAGGGPPQSQG